MGEKDLQGFNLISSVRREYYSYDRYSANRPKTGSSKQAKRDVELILKYYK